MNMNLEIVLMLLILITQIFITVKMISMINKIVMDNSSEEVLDPIELKKLDISVKDSRELLDYLVNQALIEWQIYNVNPSTENYMGESEIERSIEYIMRQVYSELTPTSREILSVGYPMNTDEEILESIKNRAKLVVLEYSIRMNEPHDNTILPNVKMF